MKNRVFSVCAVTAILTALFSAGATVHANGIEGDVAGAIAIAKEGQSVARADAEGDVYAEAIAIMGGLVEDCVRGDQSKAIVKANAYAEAGNGGWAEVYIGYWNFGYDPNSYAIPNGTIGGYYFTGNGPYIDSSSSGTVDINGNASAFGGDAFARVEVENADIVSESSGSISINATAAAEGDHAKAYIELEDANISRNSSGSIEIDATSTATGAYSYANITEVEIWLDDGASGNIYADIRATATNGGRSYNDIDAGISGGNGNYYIYSIANSDGAGSYADSDINLYSYEVPVGVYFDVDADGNAMAIALLISDGTNVWAIAYTDAWGGGGAAATINGGDLGPAVDAEVGVVPDV
ncbi:hypothetical protein ABFB09_07515 [Dehalogenimonas sp. THU2]|uniref:hypothetical protein n=1 Tax=Dehalogenimonas sp. THU2 TaxID=3151121 RepID=UPI003218B94E